MIRISIEIDNAGCISVLEATGHSNYAASGSDIVCSAVSTLLQTCFVSMSQLEGIDLDLSDDIVFKLKVGSYKDTDVHKLSGMCTFLVTGLFLIEKNYPSNVKINIKE